MIWIVDDPGMRFQDAWLTHKTIFCLAHCCVSIGGLFRRNIVVGVVLPLQVPLHGDYVVDLSSLEGNRVGPLQELLNHPGLFFKVLN